MWRKPASEATISWSLLDHPPSYCNPQEMKKLLFGKAEVEVDIDLVAKKREEVVAVRGKKVRGVGEK